MIAAITLALAAVPATSSPVTYLDCTIIQNGAPIEWQLTLNEGTGSVDYDTVISGAQRDQRGSRQMPYTSSASL